MHIQCSLIPRLSQESWVELASSPGPMEIKSGSGLGTRRVGPGNGTFVTAHFCVQLSFVLLLGNYSRLSDHKRPERGSLVI